MADYIDTTANNEEELVALEETTSEETTDEVVTLEPEEDSGVLGKVMLIGTAAATMLAVKKVKKERAYAKDHGCKLFSKDYINNKKLDSELRKIDKANRKLSKLNAALAETNPTDVAPEVVEVVEAED